MKFRTNSPIIFCISLFIYFNFQITAQDVPGSTTNVETLINSTLENVPIDDPSTISEQIESQSISTAISGTSMSTYVHSTNESESQFSTTLTTAKQPATNLPTLPPESTSINTSGTDSFSMWSHSPSTSIPEQTTSQITNQEFEVTTNETNSTQTDPSLLVTEIASTTLMMPTTDVENVSIFDSTPMEENATSTSIIHQMDEKTSTEFSHTSSQSLGSTESVTMSENNTEIEFNNDTSLVPESVSFKGTSPSTRNSTERFSDVDATPLQETASMSLSSSLSSVTYSSSLEPDTTTSKPQVVTKKWFMLQFMGNCTEMEHKFEDFKKQIHEKILSKAGIGDHQVTLNAINCTNSFLLNVSVSPESEAQLSQFFTNLESSTNSTNKFRISDETYLLNVVNSVGDNAYHQPPEVTLSSKHTDIEFVIYVGLGSACVFLLSLAVILVACKYCRSKPYKSFDLNDISHLSLGLEDFTLTRIPRPKSTSIYNEFGNKNQYSPIDQQGGGGNGMVHSYDTSVVPLEDAPNFKSENENETEPQIVGKSTQTSPTNHEYEEIDVKAVKSTENLHSLPKPAVAKHWGVDNASFSTP
uniref:SEA domain-containing protein n=1 Tax=Strigamia maritima TaxID=126957 RepID=T1JBR1_STRMM